MAGEKTEKATPKRKDDERKKGNVFHSTEVVSVFSLIVLFYAFKYLIPLTLDAVEQATRVFMGLIATEETLSVPLLQQTFLQGCTVFAVAALPMLLVSGGLSILLTGAQTRFLFSSKLLAPKFNRMSPIQGFKRMFSMRGVVELLKSIVKVTVLTLVVYRILVVQLPLFPRMMDLSIQSSLAMAGNVILAIVKNATVFFVFLAVFDYGYQWWEYEKNLRMSKQELKEEYKEMEGDPQVKGKIKEKQQAMARSRMMQQVPKADVVLRNPTHFAVAIRYDAAANASPVVIAKGADLVALKIVAIAEENGVTVVENKPLARGLYAAVDLDQEIPEQFFRPVAEVLAYVYKLRERTRK